MIPPYNSNINRKNDMNSQWKTKAFTFCSRSVQINFHRTLIFVTLRVFDVVSGCNMQRAKKVVSDSPGLVDFAIGLVNFVLNLPDGQAKIFLRIKITKVL